MRPIDLLKATVWCGVLAYAAYSVPVLSQVIVIAILAVLWLTYFRSTVAWLRQR